MTFLILHGITGNKSENWFPWLKENLLKLGHNVILTTLPKTDHPDRTEWLNAVKNLLKDVSTSELGIVGHSLGVVTALDYIETLNKPIKALICVSGFYQDYGIELNSYFMKEKEIDMEKVKQNIESIFVLYGDNDPYVPQEKLSGLAKAINVEPIVIGNGGHLNKRAGFTEFPKLLEIIKTM